MPGLTHLNPSETKKRTPQTGFFFVRYWGLAGVLYLLQILARGYFLGALGRLDLWLETSAAGWKMDLAMVGYWSLLLGLSWLFPSQKVSKWAFGIGWFVCLEVTLMTTISDAAFWVLWGSRFNAQTLVFLRYPAECLASLSVLQMVGATVATVLVAGISILFARWLFPSTDRPKVVLIPMLLLGFVAARGGIGTTPLQASSCLYSSDALNNAAAANSSWNVFFVLTQQQYKPDLTLWRSEARDHRYYSQESIKKGASLSHLNQPHVLLFIMESFSAELSAVFSNGRGLINGTSEMPFLDSLARQSLCFPNTFASGDRTDKGLAAILAGYPGQVWQSLLNEPERFGRYHGLAQSFVDRGYASSFWYGGDGKFSNTTAFAQAMGHQSCWDEARFNSQYSRDKWGVSDQDVLREMEKYLDTHSHAPQFLTWLSLSSHEPYRVAEQDERYQYGWTEMQRYRSAIRYSDQALREFWRRNAQKQWFNESLIIIIADHGRDIETGYTYVGQAEFFHIPWVIAGSALAQEWRKKQMRTIASQTDVGNSIVNGLFRTSPMLPYSRNVFSLVHPQCAAWHTEHRLGWIDSMGAVESQIEVAPSTQLGRLQALENQLWEEIETGKL